MIYILLHANEEDKAEKILIVKQVQNEICIMTYNSSLYVLADGPGSRDRTNL